MNSSSIVTLGHYSDTPPGGAAFNYYNGLLDEVRVWNVARTQAEIAANMNAEISRKTSGLVAYWRMDEGSGQTAFDATHKRKGHNQHLYDAPADPTWVPGKL